jgi:hypothetical protein
MAVLDELILSHKSSWGGMSDYPLVRTKQDETRAAVAALYEENERRRNDYANLVDRCALLRQRHDLSVDRILAYDRLVELQAENERLRAFFVSIGQLTLNHDEINEQACVYANKLGEALESVDPKWWEFK